jgi:uncharacterized protein (TIGR04255 family)
VTQDKAPALGQWANAPLVFVLVQVRFLPAAAAGPENIRDAITARLGQRFTSIVEATQVGFQINVEGQAGVVTGQTSVAGYDMLAVDMQSMVRVTRDSVSYATTSYQNSKLFFVDWMEILKALPEVGIKTVNRVGMRYVDFIIPAEGREPEDYVVAPWDARNMPKLPGANVGPSLIVHMMDVPFPEGMMRLQFMKGFGMPSLPADLQGMLPPVNSQNQNRLGWCGIIDTDRWMDAEVPSTEEQLRVSYATIHTDLSQAFRAMITPFAQEVWNPTSTTGNTP